jgi:predicted ATPase
MAASAGGADDIALLGELLSIPNAASNLNLNAQRKRERTFEALLSQLDALASRGPVLLVFEDAHWADPTSRELLDLMVDHVRNLPLLLLVTSRPEFQHNWSGPAASNRDDLNRLGGREGAALVERLAGAGALSSEMIAEIAERTDGVPLFIEELTKAVLEIAEAGDRVAQVLSATPLTGCRCRRPYTRH